MAEVAVAGVGMTPFVRRTDRSPGAQGAAAITRALADAGLEWDHVDLVVVGALGCGMSAAPQVLSQLPRTGVNAVAVENASATGSSALALAAAMLHAGRAAVAVAVGIGSLEMGLLTSQAPVTLEVADVVGAKIPPVIFGLRASRRMHDYGETEADVARVAVKNLANAANNDMAQRRTAKSLDEVLGGPVVAFPIRRDECCPLGDGAAAVVLTTSGAGGRAVPLLASVTGSDRWHPAAGFAPDPTVTGRCADLAYAQAGVKPQDLGVVEVHDAFAVEELDYCEALGLCGPGEAGAALRGGEFSVGGTVAVSPSGGLLGRGHPGGATGLAQVVEIVTQLRGEAGVRQQPGARVGLAQMIGAGGICTVHIFGT